MALLSRQLRGPVAWAPILLTLMGFASCSRDRQTEEEMRVKADFAACQTALLNRHADEVVRYLPQDVSDYFQRVNSDDLPPSPAPVVDLLLRTALEEKVSRDLRAHLTLQSLLQRAADRGLLNPGDIRAVSLGAVSVQGDRASAALYFAGRPVPVRLSFVHQGDVWKMDVLGLLPWAEILLRVDRTLTRQTETQQVNQLVATLPML